MTAALETVEEMKCKYVVCLSKIPPSLLSDKILLKVFMFGPCDLNPEFVGKESCGIKVAQMHRGRLLQMRLSLGCVSLLWIDDLSWQF